MHSILVVDDEPNYLIILSELLRDEGYEIYTASSGEEGLAIVQDVDLDLVVTDMQMPGINGMQLLEKIKDKNTHLPVIMITAFAEVEKAVAAMQAGAYNYLSKPFSNDELLVNVNKAVDHYSLIQENSRLRQDLRSRTGFSGMVGKNKGMLQVYELIEKVAPTPSSVLISGESGTGKELVAKAIHLNSPRAEKPFITVNCAALAENLLESELFGHEKGAFTGAIAMRKGRFELADGGTLFLDEIGEIPLALQAKLLRAIQEKSFERVGGSKTLHVDVRIVSATNKELKDEVKKNTFREDLYYRLNVIHVGLPALRERQDDIPLLVDYFVKTVAKRLDKAGLRINKDAMRLLVSLPWEGNVRELENTIERAAILCDEGNITDSDVQPESFGADNKQTWGEDLDLTKIIPAGTGLNAVLYAIEDKMLHQALDATGYVQARAADKLGITKSLLQYKMKKYGIKRKK
jgi:two-component system, NtrC family, response regulator